MKICRPGSGQPRRVQSVSHATMLPASDVVGLALSPTVVSCSRKFRVRSSRKICRPEDAIATTKRRPAARRGSGLSPDDVYATTSGVCRWYAWAGAASAATTRNTSTLLVTILSPRAVTGKTTRGPACETHAAAGAPWRRGEAAGVVHQCTEPAHARGDRPPVPRSAAEEAAEPAPHAGRAEADRLAHVDEREWPLR